MDGGNSSSLFVLEFQVSAKYFYRLGSVNNNKYLLATSDNNAAVVGLLEKFIVSLTLLMVNLSQETIGVTAAGRPYGVTATL